MSNTDRDSMLERWADGMETLEQYYEGIYGPPATPPSLPPITTYDAMLEAIADGIERAKRNINKKSTTYHSDSVAYVKTVPAGNVHYAELDSIGGRTLVFNQLIPNGDFSDGTTGWDGNGNPYASLTVTDGVLSCVASGSTNRTWRARTNVNITAGHKYALCGSFKRTYSGNDVDANRTDIFFGGNENETVGSIDTPTAGTVYSLNMIAAPTKNNTQMIIGTSGSVNSSADTPMFDLSNVMLIDLTLMYGSGNEPTTVQEFTAQFPANYYPYSQGGLISAGVTEVVSKKADTTTLETYSVPAEVRALEGYGYSVGSVYNYIDFEAKKFIQRVASVDLGSLTFTLSASALYMVALPFAKPIPNSTYKGNIVCPKYTNVTSNNITGPDGSTPSPDMEIALGTSNKLYINNLSYYRDIPAFTTAMSGVYLNYELQTPIETDISAYLTDDNLIEVEAGGTLTFENQHGDDYRIPVPSSETFIVGEP